MYAVGELMRELSLNNCRLDKRYDIREQLGRGSYAEIYLARDILASPQSPHSQVVIKALNVFLQNDLDDDLERTLVENFQNEAIALDRVRHPNIISRIGHGTARDLRGTVFHYLVLEYLSGGDLQGLLRKQKLSLVKALHYVEQLCSGLAHAHASGIIHRDIKPQNLLLTADLLTVKIADFGVARVQISDSPITRVGTNIYAPPEHSPMSSGQTDDLAFAKLTPSADIYSLAKSVYSLLTSEAPRAYANESITAVPESVRDEEWADELVRVLQKATANDSRERHQSVEEFWSDLAAIRQIASDGEFATVISTAVAAPQPHVARGYTPIAPAKPSFETLGESQQPINRLNYVGPILSMTARPEALPVRHGERVPPTPVAIGTQATRKKRTTFRFLAIFLVFTALFVGFLYGTASFMRGRGILPEITNPFKKQNAVANTDVYLRPSPNTDNEPIGLVTKNSKVRIVNSQNNWYQIDVIEQGRERPSPVSARRGWLNGKYLDILNN